MEKSVNSSNTHPNKSLNSKHRVGRGGKFTQSDISLLLELIRENIDIITNQKIDPISCEEKDSAWKNITMKFNEQSKTHRNINMLRKKFDNLKNTFKDKYDFQKNSWKTSSSVIPSDESLKDIMLLIITTEAGNLSDVVKDCDSDDIEECVSVKSDPFKSQHTLISDKYKHYLPILSMLLISPSFSSSSSSSSSSWDDFFSSDEDNTELMKKKLELKDAKHDLKMQLYEKKLELAKMRTEHVSEIALKHRELFELMKK